MCLYKILNEIEDNTIGTRRISSVYGDVTATIDTRPISRVYEDVTATIGTRHISRVYGHATFTVTARRISRVYDDVIVTIQMTHDLYYAFTSSLLLHIYQVFKATPHSKLMRGVYDVNITCI